MVENNFYAVTHRVNSRFAAVYLLLGCIVCAVGPAEVGRDASTDDSTQRWL